jgi:hypothetical protein
MINYKVSDHIIDSIDAFIAEVISDLDLDAKFYVLDGLGDVVSNQRYELEQTLSEGDQILMGAK